MKKNRKIRILDLWHIGSPRASALNLASRSKIFERGDFWDNISVHCEFSLVVRSRKPSQREAYPSLKAKIRLCVTLRSHINNSWAVV